MYFSIVPSMGETMAEWGGMTPPEKVRENRLRRQAKRLGLAVRKGRARMTHIANLLLLAPTIQNAILCLSPVKAKRDDLTERNLRAVIGWVDWRQQERDWLAPNCR